MSEVRVNKLSPRSGTTVTLGDSGDTITIPSGVTLANSGTIDNLNASNLTSGTVPDARITGAYTGITNLDMSGDLTVDTNTLKVDSTNNRVGISEASPQTTLHVDGTGALFEGMSIDTNLANVTSSFSRQNTGFNYRTTEGLNVTTNSNASASLNRKSDGRILDFFKNDTRKGSISIGDNGISISLGGTATANTLDDYEEGTFTPTFTATGTSFSYSQQHGFYTKIGRSVTCHIFIRAQSSGATSNALKITNLPFTSLSSGSFYASPTFGQIESVDYPSGALEITGNVAGSATQIDLQYSRDNQGQLNLPASAIDDATSNGFMVSINYFTD